MFVAGFLQIVGFLWAAFNTAVALFVLYGFSQGAETVDALLRLLTMEINISPETVVFFAVALVWLLATVPAFLMLATGLSTEAQLNQNDETRKLLDALSKSEAMQREMNQQLARAAASLEEIRQISQQQANKGLFNR